jgi:hypothetical protein
MKVGDKVRLLKGRGYRESDWNPVKGSKFEVIGTITELNPTYDWDYRVVWTDRPFHYNVYKHGDLELVVDPILSVLDDI